MTVAPVIRELASIFSGEVLLVAEHCVPPGRAKQGWLNPNFGKASVLIGKGDEFVAKVVAEYSEDSTVHIVAGISAYENSVRALAMLSGSKVRLGVYSEPGRSNDWKSPLRRVFYRRKLRQVQAGIDFLMPSGELGAKWFCDCGFSRSKMLPFGYFVDEPDKSVTLEAMNDRVRFLFVGQLIHRKGVDILVRAAERIRRTDFELDFVGSGPLQEKCMQLSARLASENRVRWHGNRPNSEVSKMMRGFDCLVLPSRFDGWGAVTNEAMMAGIPVIATDACGSQDLIHASGLGIVVQSNSVDSLVRAMDVVIDAGPISRARRRTVMDWSRQSISPAVVARYLLSFLERPNEPAPLAPWFQVGSTQFFPKSEKGNLLS